LVSTTQPTFAQSTHSGNLNLSPPPIIKVEIFNKSNGVWKDQTISFWKNQSLVFDESDNNLKINLAEFDSTNSNHFQYSYRIGKSNPWIQLENNILKIQNIPPAQSILEIKHRIENGEWTDHTFEISIYRQQPFYFRSPFLIGILVTIIALFYFFKKRKPKGKPKQDYKIGEKINTKKESLDPLPNELEELLSESIPIQEKREIIEKNPPDDWLKKLIKNANLLIDDRKFSIIQLAETMNLSERQFRRKLKQKTGLRPAEYMREIRLLKAEYFLKNNTYSTVAEVCYTVGFSTPKHFSKIFKERFGKNPSFYLNNKKSS
jgi:AraC-like DNA-binding protein